MNSRKATALHKMASALRNDDCRLAISARELSRHDDELWNLASRTIARFVAYPDNDASEKWKISCRPMTDDQIKSAVNVWVESARAKADQSSNLVAEVIADSDCHPIWRERAIAVLANNEFGAGPDDRRFVAANIRAALYYVPVEHPHFDELGTNIVRYFFDRHEDSDTATANVNSAADQNGDTEAAKRIKKIAKTFSTPPRPRHVPEAAESTLRL